MKIQRTQSPLKIPRHRTTLVETDAQTSYKRSIVSAQISSSRPVGKEWEAAHVWVNTPGHFSITPEVVQDIKDVMDAAMAEAQAITAKEWKPTT